MEAFAKKMMAFNREMSSVHLEMAEIKKSLDSFQQDMDTFRKDVNYLKKEVRILKKQTTNPQPEAMYSLSKDGSMHPKSNEQYSSMANNMKNSSLNQHISATRISYGMHMEY